MADLKVPKLDQQQPENGRPSPGGQFFWEIIVFLTGLFIGFFWYMYLQSSPNTAEVHLIIGLIVIIICMARFVYLLWQSQQKQ